MKTINELKNNAVAPVQYIERIEGAIKNALVNNMKTVKVNMYRHLTDDDILAIMRELETAGYQATAKQECQDPYTNEYYTVFTITY